MCKYCKRLKELKDLDEKLLLKIIQKWRRIDLEARKLLGWCVVQLDRMRVPVSVVDFKIDLTKCEVDWSYGEMLDRIENFIGK